MDILNFPLLISRIELYYAVLGYPIVFIGSILEGSPLSFLIPVGTFVLFGGFFAASSPIPLIGIIISGWLGTWIAYLTAYTIGYRKGDLLGKILKQEKALTKAKELFRKHGIAILSTTLLAAFMRFWIAYVAGSEKFPQTKFIVFSGFASLAWTSFLVMGGYVVGIQRSGLEQLFGKLGLLAVPAMVLLIVFIFLTLRKQFTPEGIVEE